MGIPASSFFMGTLFEGPDAVVVAVFRDFTIQMISEIMNMKKRTLSKVRYFVDFWYEGCERTS